MKVAFRVTGRVQGVGYRMFALGEARAAAVGGWIRNARDGAVEGELEGRPEQVSALRSALGKGPPWGNVADLEWRILDEDAGIPSESLPHPFEIRR
jgi:acylphosphatase